MGKSKHIVPKDDPQVTNSLGAGEAGSGKTPFPQGTPSLMVGSPTTSKHHPALALQSALPAWGRTAARADVVQTEVRDAEAVNILAVCGMDHV